MLVKFCFFSLLSVIFYPVNGVLKRQKELKCDANELNVEIEKGLIQDPLPTNNLLLNVGLNFETKWKHFE